MKSQNIKTETTGDNLSATEAEILENCITCTPIDYFYYRYFKYAGLRDVLEQAKREARGL